MQYVKTSTAKSFYIEFNVNDDLVVPDNNSVTLTLTKPDGTALSGYDQKNITPPSGASYVVVDIDSSAHSKTLDYEFRHLELNFIVNSKPEVISFNYRIVDRTNIPVTPQEVRILVGLSDNEWEDDNIDIIDAYYKTQQDTDLVLDTELSAGNASVYYILEAIKYRAAIQLSKAIELIAIQSEQADNVSFRRFEKVDFKALKQSLLDGYSNALKQAETSNDTSLTYVRVSQGADAVTGV